MNIKHILVRSVATLIKASIAAVIIVTITLVLVMLPAEYNIDPTRVGKALQLTLIAQAAEVTSVEEVATD